MLWFLFGLVFLALWILAQIETHLGGILKLLEERLPRPEVIEPDDNANW